MAENKSYRIRTTSGEEYVDINLGMNQDIDMFEMLSLKIDSENFYRLHTSNYGCIAGRVLANDAVGVPNVKISLFIAADAETKADSVLSYLYPYSNVGAKNDNNIVYNLLSEEQIDACHQNVGTFPSKRLVLDDANVFEVYDKYYKFTTTTNSAGDYMIFGVPLGTQTLHMDVDLSDIGDLLSQTPRDFIYKGYDINEFESPSKFKGGTSLESLPQILSQNDSVYVHPFWGDPSEMGESDSTGVRITRKDINLDYKFEPTCIFMGSIITDEKSNGFTKNCIPTERMGKMDRLTTGEGTIEMIRKTPDGNVESFNVQGAHLIDGDGTWCYQIPMNLDYVKTDEYGNIVPTDNPNKGLPTRTRVRFRVSLNDMVSDYENNHLVKMLVPNNPKELTEVNGDAYVFGTNTPDSEFRDLLWNKVYSVKSYIPRLQKSDMNREKRFSGIKAVNVNGGNNPTPYNNMRIDITFMFVMQCAIMHTLIWIAGVVNSILSLILHQDCCGEGKNIRKAFNQSGSCVTIGDGACPDLEGWYFAPNCPNVRHGSQGQEPFSYPLQVTVERLQQKENGQITGVTDSQSIEQKNSGNTNICVTNQIEHFIQCIETALAQEYEVIQFDFYNDWLNGVLYIPRWFANIKKKRNYLFGLIRRPEKIQACMEDTFSYRRRYTQQCALTYKLTYEDGSLTKYEIGSHFGCGNGQTSETTQRCHKGYGRKHLDILKDTKPGGGFVHQEPTTQSQYVYYFRPCDFSGSTRINYFLTDIILLGSVNENDIDGVPQSFKELISSTYTMPPNIAATNMDYLGRMYGLNGVKCGEPSERTSVTSAATATEISQTFEATEEWMSETEDSISATSDSSTPITEISGIDWGYRGPEQGGEAFESDFSFLPGGHFLGLSCFNSQSNIKSCVNLSRICEIGVEPSQRHPILYRNSQTQKRTTMPTGLISREEISDGSFRSAFATLNYNGLKTTKNVKTGRYEYEVIPMSPMNFDGTFENKMSRYYNYEGSLGVTSTHTYEKPSIDYILFRFGINSFDEIVGKFGAVNPILGLCSLPMYENSFYFYFGLHDGATALDKFYEKYYAECPVLVKVSPMVVVSAQNIKVCSSRSTAGAADVITYGIPGEYTSGLTRSTDGGETYSEYTDAIATKEGNVLKLTNLTVGKYKITIVINDGSSYTSEFDISRNVDYLEECGVDIAVTQHFMPHIIDEAEPMILSEASITIIILEGTFADYFNSIEIVHTTGATTETTTYNTPAELEVSSIVVANERRGTTVEPFGHYKITFSYTCRGGSVKVVKEYDLIRPVDWEPPFVPEPDPQEGGNEHSGDDFQPHDNTDTGDGTSSNNSGNNNGGGNNGNGGSGENTQPSISIDDEP